MLLIGALATFYVALNTDALVAYREGRIDTARVIQALKPLAPAP